jgi:Uma2 family endonuclease
VERESTKLAAPFEHAADLNEDAFCNRPQPMETATLWRRVLNDPQLQELPYKIETNEHGQIVLSPHKPQHGIRQSKISDLLRDHAPKAGTRAVEFAVDTTKGVKVPDVVWISADRLAEMPNDAEASPIMPEIVVEVLSEGNTEDEIDEKRQLYLNEGAQEVWMCAADGAMTFYDETGAIERSAIIPSFPNQIE